MTATPRRQFLQSVAGSLALASLGTAPSRAEQASQSASLSEFEGVRLAIATICCDGFGDENFEPTFRLLPTIGFQFVEFNCWFPRTLTPAGLASIAERSRQVGVTPICVQGSAFGDGSVTDVAHKLWCLEAARQLGCRRVKFTGARRGTQGGLAAVIRTLNELAPAAADMDILVCVENHAANNLENIDDYEEVFEAIDSPHVGMCLDTGHFDGAGVDIPEVIRRFHSRIVHVDLKDCQTRGTYKTVRFGEGITDCHGTIRDLLERGYRGYLVVEQAPPIDPKTLATDLRQAYELFHPYEQG